MQVKMTPRAVPSSRQPTPIPATVSGDKNRDNMHWWYDRNSSAFLVVNLGSHYAGEMFVYVPSPPPGTVSLTCG